MWHPQQASADRERGRGGTPMYIGGGVLLLILIILLLVILF